MNKAAKDIFDDANEVQSNWAKFNVPQEDKIAGTLIAKRKVKSTLPGKEGEESWVYDVKADTGTFHVLDDQKQLVKEPVIVHPNEIWSVGGKDSIDRQMQNVPVGAKVGFKFIDTQPSKTKGFAPMKNIKVFVQKNDDGTPLMDQAWLDSQAVA